MKINNLKCLSLFDGISGCQQALKNLGIEFEKGDSRGDNSNRNLYFASEVDTHAIKITQKNFPNTIQLGDVKSLSFIYNTENEPNNYYTIRKQETIVEKQGIFNVAKNIDYEMYPIENIDLLSAGFPCQDLSIAKKNGKGLDGERSGLFYELLRIIKEVKPKNILIENVSSMKKEWKEKISQELGFGFTEINSSLLTAQQRKRLYWIGKLQQDGTYKKVEIEQPQDKGILLKDILDTPLCNEEYVGNLFNKRIFIDKVGTLGTGSGRTNKQGMCIFRNDWEFVRKLTPIEYERLQGFSDNYSDNVSNTQRYKALGNSFTVPVIEHILKAILYETK